VHSLLWIDEDLDEWWSVVSRIAAELNVEPAGRVTIAEGLEYLHEQTPAVLLLDVITRTGMMDENLAREFGRYTGLVILKQFPELRTRTVIFSVVPREMIESTEVTEGTIWVGKTHANLTNLRQSFETILGVK